VGIIRGSDASKASGPHHFAADSVPSPDEKDFLTLAEQAEKAALDAHSRAARRFLQSVAEEYRRRAEKPKPSQQKGTP